MAVAVTNDIEIPLSRPDLGETELEAIREVFASGWVAGQGPACALLEETIRRDTGSPFASVCSNCTTALHMALLSLGIGEGDEVIVGDYSFPASAHAILYTGAKPVFADVLPDSGNIDPAKIESLINDKTRAIMPVHVFGKMAQMEPIRRIADEYGLRVIEDAACAYGSKDRDGHRPGELSDAACFSFHARKNVTCGEGGAVITKDEGIYESIRSLTFFGVASANERAKSPVCAPPEFSHLGYNYKMADILAAVAKVQLDRRPGFLAMREKLADNYRELLADGDAWAIPGAAGKERPVWQSYVITLAAGIDRQKAIAAMRKRGIECQIGTYAMHLQPVYGKPGQCPISADLFERHLALPFFPGLTAKQQSRVAEALLETIMEVR